MEETTLNYITYSLLIIALTLLTIQVFLFFRIRKSLSQITMFFRFVNRIIKDMEKFQISATASIHESQQIIQSMQQGKLRSNQENTCMICRHRVSFLRFDNDHLGFTYQCGQTKKVITLKDTCPLFEPDKELKH